MALGDIGVVLDTLLLRAGSSAVAGEVTHVTGNFFAAVFQEGGGDREVILVTFSVDDAGVIPPAITATRTVATNASFSGYPSIIKAHDGVVVVGYDDDDGGVAAIVRSFTVDAFGAISVEVDNLDISNTSTQINVTQFRTQHTNLFATLIEETTGLRLKTYTVDASGNFSVVLDDELITANPGNSPRARLVWTGQGDFYAISYEETITGDGILQTHTISALGIIGAVTDTLIFDGDSSQSALQTNDAGRLTVYFEGPAARGIVKTVDVDGSGMMTNGPQLNTPDFFTAQGMAILRIDEQNEDVFLGAASDTFGLLRTWTIAGDGTPSQIDFLTGIDELDESAGIALKPGNTAIIVACGMEIAATNDFFVISVGVESVGGGAAAFWSTGGPSAALLLL